MIPEGTRLGIYRVGAELGRGGMGTVYRGQGETDGPAGPAGSVVALKVIHPGLVDDERSLERFAAKPRSGSGSVTRASSGRSTSGGRRSPASRSSTS